MADCRWINANGGNWNTAANWSTGTVPTAADNVIIDAASFAVNGKVITIDVVANCLNLDCSGADQAFTITNSAYAFNIYGNITEHATNLIWNFTGTGYMYIKGNCTIITNGNASHSINRLYVDAAGCLVQHADDFNAGSIFLTIVNGVWNTNNKTITVSSLATGFGTKTLTFGSSTVNVIGPNNCYWHATAAANTTVNAGTSTIIFASVWYPVAATYYNVVVKHLVLGYLSGNPLFNDLTITKYCIFEQYGYFLTITNNLIVSGVNPTNNRAFIYCTILGLQGRIICNGNVAATNTDFRDVLANGTANWDLSSAVGGSGDCGGNSGITFTMAQPQWFKHTSGAVNWSNTAKWFSDQAKTIAGRVPLPQDDATFDAGSFSNSSTLTLDSPRIGRNFNMSGVSQSVMIIFNSDIECYGDFILGINILPSLSYAILLMKRDGCNFNASGKTLYGLIAYNLSGVVTNLNDFSLTAYLSISVNINSSFDVNDFNITIGYFSLNNGRLYCGSGQITIIGFSTYVIYNLGTIYGENSTIIFSPPAGVTNYSLAGNGNSFNRVKFSGIHAGNFNISGSNAFNEIIIDPGRKVRFTAGTTNTIAKLTAIGTAANPITIGSITNAQHTLALAAGNPEVECDYLNISYSNATVNKFFAGSHSINSGNNTGWIFTDLTRFYAWASAYGMGSAAATLQLKNLLQAIASGTSVAEAALLQLRQMVASAAGVTTANLQLHASRYITAIATGQATADSYVHVLLPIASAAQGTSAASLAMHQLIYALANAAGISVTEATLLVYAYPVEIFEAISKITTVLEARSAITAIILDNSAITTEFTQNSNVF